MNLFKNFAKDESGATAIEYGLIAALMAVVVIAAISIIGPALETNFTNIAADLTNPTLTPQTPQ
ncbi:Flp family type IVb pilin [Pelagibacterium luteolum]|uniref:Pilus assembly protein Flp/PilA n=1 Tax=Pelagibacterium luteolum TaxID=440168 RepID=A0A1G7VMC5_9HYPH|nr:Flp family type IVb pilin [Pelagibacterium luteolum]SDG60847.1 pilus assembly protein Flp/PilA [Pelagibacterium luteolum]